jgi:hypothetical protein
LSALEKLQARERALAAQDPQLTMKLLAAVAPRSSNVFFHPRALEEIPEEQQQTWFGFEFELLCGLLDQGVVPSRKWPGSETIFRYDCLMLPMSVGFVPIQDEKYCILGFLPRESR